MEITQQLEVFFVGLSSKLESAQEIKEQYNKTMALDFNIFNNFFHLGENKTSEILAFFLNPKQTHGQGSIFLELFLGEFDLDKKLAEKEVEVKCEHLIENNRRIDIYITFGLNEYIIAIENKIWAEDQHRQLHDYNRHLDYTKVNYTLFYLNPYGNLPSNLSIVEDELYDLIKTKKIKIIDYKDNIIGLIDLWYKNCEAERVRFVLNDFKQYLNQEINRIKIIGNNSETIANYIIDSNNLEIAFEMNNTINIIKEKLIRIFKDQIDNIKCDKIEIVKSDGSLWYNESNFYFYIKNSEKKYHIAITFYRYFESILYGVDCADVNKDKDIRVGISKEIEEEGLVGWEKWAWVREFEEKYIKWQYKTEPWLDIKNGTLINNIKEKIEKLIDVLTKLNVLV